MKNLKFLFILLFIANTSFVKGQFITPTAGSTQTFNVTTNGQIFTDPSDGINGGPGGVCTGTSSGNTGDYPNCGCTTVTTLCAQVGQTVSVNFTSFNIFGNFDILNIYNGSNINAPQIYNSNLNTNTDNLAGMIAANGSGTFNSTGQNCLTFSFVATTVVNSCGWEAGVTVSGATGPPPPVVVTMPIPCAGNALDFDGVDDNVVVPNGSAGLLGSNISISGWVFPGTSNQRFQGYFGLRNNTNADFYLLQLSNSTNLEARFRNSAGTVFTITANNAVTVNTWQHFALTYDGTTLRLYKNGVQLNTLAASGSITNGTEPFRMGEFQFPGDRFPFRGRLDKVATWNSTRTAAQILSEFNTGIVQPAANLTAIYRMNQGVAAGNNMSITTLNDGSGNNRNGNIANLALIGSGSNFVQSGNFYGTINAGIGVAENSGVPNDGNVTPGTTVVISAAGGTSYLWSTGATTSSITVMPSNTTTYSVTITSGTCSVILSQTITTGQVDPCLLICAGNQNVFLPPGSCEYQIPNLVTSAGNCENLTIVQKSLHGAGDNVGPGTYVLSYDLVSAMGIVLESCTITVVVNSFNSPSGTLTCNDHINISVDNNCRVTLSADMFLEGNSYSCYTNYQINIWPFNSQANAINNVPQGVPLNIPAGDHTYEIIDGTGNSCWGTFSVEDKLPPVISCNCVDDPTQIQLVTSLVSPDGNFLDTNSPRYDRPTGATPAACTPTTGGRYYKTIEFEVNVTGTYTFNSNPSDGDTYGSLYQINFDPNFPCQNYLTGNDDGAGALDPLITIALTAGVKYIYVFSGFGATTVSSNFVINVTAAPTGGSVVINKNPANEPECKFRCFDIDIVQRETVGMLYNIPGQNQNRSKLTIPPTVQDACGSVSRTFEDRISTAMCGATKLIRDWTFTDASGNVSKCSQTFTFNQIKISDLTPPREEVNFTCGLESTPQTIAGYTDMDSRTGALSATNIGAFADDWAATPTVVELQEGHINAYFTYNQIGFDGNQHAQKLDIDVCNIYASYTDDMFPACGTACGGNMKVVRNWKLLDWCTGEVFEYSQVIKAVDQKEPSFDLKDVTISVSPWECEVDWNVEKPWELQDNCAKPEEIKWGIKVIPGLVVTGTQPNYTVRGLTKGVHDITYWAEDCCGNYTEKVARVTVLDLAGPIPVAKQNIVLSLSGSGSANDGTAKMYGWQIDDGSYDQCTDVRFEVRRLSGGACGNFGANGTHDNNSTYNDHNGFPSEIPGSVWFHPNDNSQDTDSGEYVKFCCEDIPAGADFGLHEVELRVWDDGNMNGIYGDNLIINGMKDNYNTTWATIRVENKLVPTLICPPDVTVTCDMEINMSLDADTEVSSVNLNMTGYPRATDLCANLSVTYRDAWVGQHNAVCKSGTIRRTFKITKGNTVITCPQLITLTTVTVPFTVTFPQNNGTTAWDKCTFTLEDARNAGNPTIKKPIVNYGQCDIVGENIKIDTFLFEDGACKKWRVEYTYRNWCTDQVLGGYVHYYTYKDNIAPVVVCANQMFEANPNTQNPLGGCEGLVTLEASASDALVCAEESWVKWQVFFDGWANGTIDRLASSFVNKSWNGIWVPQTKFIAGQLNPTWVAIQNQHPGIILEELIFVTYVKPTEASGGNVKLPVFVLDAENINHKVFWKITDGCGNVDQCESTVMVADKKAPTPYCVSLHTALMQSNPKMVELWAKDFDRGAFDNCSPQSKLFFTFDGVAPIYARINEEHFYKAGANGTVTATSTEYAQGRAYRWLPSMRSAGKVWTSTGTFNVNVDVWDEAWNTDYCSASLKVTDNNPTGSRIISGKIATEYGAPLINLPVTVDANEPEFPKTILTDGNGFYSVTLSNQYDHMLSVNKDDDYLNGISTLDLVYIQRHILGTKKLESDYQYIAADANNDGKVTASDLTEIRKVILGISPKFNNQSWRFLDPNGSVNISPITFVEVILADEDLDNDFFAIKIGDINGSANTTFLKSGSLEGRSKNDVTLTISDAVIAAGQVVEIPVTAANFSDVAGFQYTMNLEGACFVGINSGAIEMTANNVGVLANGVVTMSYASNEAVNANEGEVLFTLVVRADKATTVSEILSMSSDVTKAESYNSDLKVGNVSLSVRTAPVASIELFQNEPNPWKGQTTVSFHMPVAATATLSVYDVTGKVVTVRNIDAAKGLNSEVFTKEQLGVSGVLYYTLVSGEFTATKKMIIVE
jgi:hypothetical protein